MFATGARSGADWSGREGWRRRNPAIDPVPCGQPDAARKGHGGAQRMSVAPSLPVPVIEEIPLDRLRPDPANPRRISEDELDALERSLRQFGFVQPALARRGTPPSSAGTSASSPPAALG